MKLAAIVIWYNPEQMEDNVAIKNVLSYSEHVQKVYIIDNSNSDNSKLASNIKNSVYVANKKNLGIAKALNIGCKRAYDDHFDWVITMDQDGYFENNEFKKYIKLVDSKILSNPKIKSYYCSQNESQQFEPIIRRIKRNIIRTVTFSFFNKDKKESKGNELDECITSANIINLKTWEELGGFDDFLFIDWVDIDFCYRLKENGYKIQSVRECYSNHTLGNVNMNKWVGGYVIYNDFRMYHIIRNYKIMCKRHHLSKLAKYRAFSLVCHYCICSKHPIRHLKVLIKAHKDFSALKNSIGYTFKSTDIISKISNNITAGI